MRQKVNKNESIVINDEGGVAATEGNGEVNESIDTNPTSLEL